jgi:superoxide dismutase
MSCSASRCGCGSSGWTRADALDFGALEPYGSAEMLVLHHDKHHAGYVAKVARASPDPLSRLVMSQLERGPLVTDKA